MLDDKLKQQIFLEIAMPICTREKVMLMHKFVQHGKTSCLEHSIAVAYNSFLMAEAMGTEYDRESLIRGGLLHDYFLYKIVFVKYTNRTTSTANNPSTRSGFEIQPT